MFTKNLALLFRANMELNYQSRVRGFLVMVIHRLVTQALGRGEVNMHSDEVTNHYTFCVCVYASKT